jgi:hypothetical protein
MNVMRTKSVLFLNILTQIQQMKFQEKPIDSRNIDVPGKNQGERIKVLLDMMKRGFLEGNPLPDENGEVGLISDISLMTQGRFYITQHSK